MANDVPRDDRTARTNGGFGEEDIVRGTRRRGRDRTRAVRGPIAAEARLHDR